MEHSALITITMLAAEAVVVALLCMIAARAVGGGSVVADPDRPIPPKAPPDPR
jgi:hypothetical protein